MSQEVRIGFFFALLAGLPVAGAERVVTQADCLYSADPEEYLLRESRARRSAYERGARGNEFGVRMSAGPAQGNGRGQVNAVAAGEIPVRNLVDEEILGRLAVEGIPAALVTSDEVFVRRVMLDLTGRAPLPREIREFLAKQNPGKRDELINTLLFSKEFAEKWTMWLGDLVQNSVTAQSINQNVNGRNRMHEWILASVDGQKSLRDFVTESLIGTGNNYDQGNGPVNNIVRGFTPMGPVEDHYDGTLVRVATAYLGLSHYDCLLCHDGAPRLRQITLWGNAGKRADAQKMAAFFARTQWTRPNFPATDFYFQSTVIDNIPAATKFYSLSSTSGNRPSRITKNPADPTKNLASYTPVYRDGRVAGNGLWRNQFAEFLVSDPMFAKNLANRLWKAMFNTGLVEPVDSLDPLRLDSRNPPPAPWTYQTPHVVLLERLAGYLQASDFNLREFLRLLATSSTYQLSSSYDGEWNIEKVPYFPRHYARRLEGEEVHDILVRATGLVPRYTVGGWTEPVSWAMQLPDPLEPRSNGGVAAFLNTFQRGNRDNVPRNQSGSILMRLNLMNNAVVTDRVRMNNSPVLQAIRDMASGEAMVEELYLAFLARRPSEEEKVVVLRRLAGTNFAQRTTVLEDVAWALVNKVEFVFSY